MKGLIMGYYTYYSMEARKIKDKNEFDAIIEEMTELELYGDNGIFCESSYYEQDHEAFFRVCDDAKWYDHTYDMVKFSKVFPNVVFRLHGDGEDRDDMWNEYYHNGEVEECRAQIIYPEPCNIEW